MNRASVFVLLLVSLAANAAMLIALVMRPTLAGGVGSLPRQARDPELVERASRPELRVPTAVQATNPGRLRRAGPAAEAALRAQLWSTLHTGDLRALIARLQTAGFPPQDSR